MSVELELAPSIHEIQLPQALRLPIAENTLLHARPPTGRGLYRGVIEEEIPPEPAVSRNVHAHPVVVVIKTVRDVVLLRCRDELVITNGLEARLRVRPGKRGVVTSDPDSGVVILAARRIFDVVADIERTIDARAQLFVEMAAVIDPATDPRDVERARSGATEGNIGAERHR